MEWVQLGATGLKVSPVGFGCSRLGGVFAGVRREDHINLLRSALEQGINFFDTSDLYTQGESERLLGEAFRRRRSDVVIASKAGYVLPAQLRLADRIKPVLRPVVRRLGLKRAQLPQRFRGSLAQDFSADYLVKAVEASLKRLRTDYLDLYQLHSPPAEVIGKEEQLEVLESLRRQGKIRFYGYSCETAGDAVAAMKTPVHAVQVRLSLVSQAAVDGLLAEAPGRHVAFIARECLAGGALAKSPEALGHSVEQGLVREADRRQIEGFRTLTESWGRSLTDIAMQFVRSQPGVSVVLVGMSTERHLRDGVAATKLAPLTQAEANLLRATWLETVAGPAG